MDREEAAFKWNLWSWTQTEILGGISTGELEATDKLDRSFFRIWETCRKEALNRSLVCSENFKQLVEWLAPSCEWTKANLIWPSKWRSMTIRYSKTDLWKIFQATQTVWMFLTFFFKLQLQKYKWAKGNLKFQRWSHLSSMTLSPSILPKKALRLFVMVASSLLVLGNKWSSPKLTVTVANLNCVHLYWIVFVFVIATGRSSTSHRSHGLCHWFH